MKTYTRSKIFELIEIEGKPTKLSVLCKDTCAMMFHYCIQFPCGGWVEFDVRDVTGVTQEQVIDDFLIKKFPPHGITIQGRLKYVAELLKGKTFGDFRIGMLEPVNEIL